MSARLTPCSTGYAPRDAVRVARRSVSNGDACLGWLDADCVNGVFGVYDRIVTSLRGVLSAAQIVRPAEAMMYSPVRRSAPGILALGRVCTVGRITSKTQQGWDMGTDFSPIGNVTSAPAHLAGTSQPEQNAAPIAQEVLRDAPPSLERSLDEAKEMATVPERDVPEATLVQRNEETSETLAGRDLAAAVARDDATAAHDAAAKLEGRAFTPQLHGLLEQAKVCGGVASDGTTMTSTTVGSGKTEGAPISSPSDIPTSSESPAPLASDTSKTVPGSPTGTAGSGSVSSPVATDSEVRTETGAPLDGPQDDTVVDESSDIPLEERIRELDVPEELFVMLRDFKPGPLGDQRMTINQLRAREARLAELLDAAPTGEGDTESYDAILKARLMETRIQLSNAIESRTHLEARIADLNRLLHDETAGKTHSMDALADLSLAWRNGREQTQAMERMAAGDPQALQNAAEGLSLGIGVVGEDLEVLERTLVETAATLLRRFQPPENALTHDTLRDLARLSLHAGQRPEVMLDMLQQGMTWVTSAGHRDTLVRVLTAGVAGITKQVGLANPAGRAEMLRYVDMVFQGAYPEYADTALELKKLLLPGHEQEVELQHQCTVASRHLLSLLLAGEGPSGKTRADALERTFHGMETASARSYLLTPNLVNSLSQKVDIPDFNYHLAHVVLLQKHAIDAGLLPLTGEGAALASNVREWCQALGLDARVVDYAERLHLDLNDAKVGARYQRELQRACDHFVRGFRGETEVSEAGRLVIKRAKLTGTSGAARREHSLYESSPDYLARLALDHHIVNLTGLIRPEERFVQGDNAMTLDGAAVDAAMARQADALYKSLLGDESPEDARARVEGKAQKQREFLSDLQRFEDHAGTMRTLAHSTGEAVRLRAAAGRDEKLVKAMEQDRALLQTTWPHRRAGRMNVCKTVLDIESLYKELSALPENASAAERADLQRQMDELLKQLHGVSPFTLGHSFRRRNDTPDLETVLQLMLPRARALQFFEARIYVNGLPSTRAKETLRRISQARSEISQLQKGIDKSVKALSKQIGKDNIRQIQQMIAAGLYKVFVESQQPMAVFSINDPQTERAVRDQLRTWGLPVDASLTNQFIKLTLASLTAADGTLDAKMLRREAGLTHLDFAGKASAKTMKQELRDEGVGRLAARRQTRDFINNTLLSDERRRAEGVRALMRDASLPGSGFVYDRARGMVMDTGAIFLPTSSPTSLVNLVDLSHPLSVRLRLMHDNSLTVCNMGNGCYQVMLKGGFAASIGATMKIAIPGTSRKAVVGGNVGSKNEHGLALTFSSARDCEAFLNVFMRPDSGVHLNSPKRPESSVLLAATQIRFIDGRTVSADVSVGLTASLFQKALGHGVVASGSGTITLGLAGEVTRQVEQNAWGETTSFSVKGRAALSAATSIGLVHGTTMLNSRKSAAAQAMALDFDQRFKVATGPQGLLPSCCSEMECQVGPLKAGITQDIARLLLLPDTVRERMNQDPAFCSAFEKLVRGLPPTARITVHSDLKPSVLEAARGLFIKARMATDETSRNDALQKAHALLASLDSYTPTRLSIKNVTPANIAKNWSPGLGAFQYARNTSLARFSAGAPLVIPLPQAE